MPYNSTVDVDDVRIKSNGDTVHAKEDAHMTATCKVRGGRPKPKMSWVLKRPDRQYPRSDQVITEVLDVDVDEVGHGEC